METLKQALKVAALAAAVALMIAANLVFVQIKVETLPRIAATINDTDATVVEIKRTAKAVADYAEKQKIALENPKNQKAIDAAIQTAAVFNGTGRLFNTQVIPRAMNTLDSLNKATNSLNELVRNTDRSLNERLLPDLAETAKTLGVSIDSLAKGILVITEKGGISIDEINALLADPQWKAALASVASTAAHLDAMAGNVEKASDSAPGIAAAIEKIAKTSSRYQKLLILAQLLATVARAF
jgi:hypothetical protein